MDDFIALRSRLQASLGQIPLDLLVRQVQLVEVHTGQVVPADLAIHGGRVVSTLPGAFTDAAEVLEAEEAFALPGLIDAHVHIESTLLTPAALAEVVLPTGTTTLLVDPMEIANVAGPAGLEAFLAATHELPYRIFVQVSSRVPTAPGLETSGGELGPEEVQRLLARPESVSLGELDPSKVLGLSEPHLRKVLAAQALGKLANGHAIGLDGAALQAYAAAGLSDDHECVDIDQLQERLACGMGVMIREGSSERNLEDLVRGVVERELSTHRLMFCTDDKHPSDIRAEGHINFNVNQAIRLGIPAIAAIQMATINAARHFRLDQLVGSLAPGRLADLLLCDSLERVEPHTVIVGGQVVAKAGQLSVRQPAAQFPDWLRRTVHLRRELAPSDFAFPAEGSAARVRAIQIVPDQIVSRLREVELPVVGGMLQPDPASDVLKLAAIERHGKNGNLAVGWTIGFGLQRGAIASSVAHDHHNLLVVGVSDDDMLAAARALERSQGGFVAVSQGQVLALLPLPLAGLMSERPAAEVEAGLGEVRRAAASLGCRLATPFMTLSFVSLPSIPEAGFSDLGLIDVASHSLIPVLVEAG